jgi:hypothetical protein
MSIIRTYINHTHIHKLQTGHGIQDSKVLLLHQLTQNLRQKQQRKNILVTGHIHYHVTLHILLSSHFGYVNKQIQKEFSSMFLSRPLARGARGCNAHTTNLDEPTRNMQNFKDKQADQPAKKCTTPYCTHITFAEPLRLETTHF